MCETGLKKLAETAKGAILAADNGTRHIMIEYPSIGKSTLELIKTMPHTSVTKNGIYEASTVECDVECKVSECSLETVRFKPSWRYVTESYDEYVSSEVHESKEISAECRIYEDADYEIFSDDKNGVLVWYCVFKSGEIHSIRELRDINALTDLKDKIYGLLSELDITREKACMYFDYTGKSKALVLNIVDISKTLYLLKCSGKFVYLDVLLNNLNVDSEYYRGDINYIRQTMVALE